MSGRTEVDSLRLLRTYMANLSQPLACKYASCAVVGSAGKLRGAAFGKAIDAHEAVIRVNAAPVRGFESAVGSRTTWRVHVRPPVSNLWVTTCAAALAVWLLFCPRQRTPQRTTQP